jgi:Uma2 family endonuclease
LAGGIDADGHLCVAPELIVEVLSPGSANERRDRELKLKLYSREGVDEYLLVDRFTRTVTVYRRAGDALELVERLENSNSLSSPLLPGFRCRASDLWAPALE